MILLSTDHWPGDEPSDAEIRSYYLPEPTARGTLYGSCMVCGMTTAHEHAHGPETPPAQYKRERPVHETCDDCWDWYACATAALLNTRIDQEQPEPTRTI